MQSVIDLMLHLDGFAEAEIVVALLQGVEVYCFVVAHEGRGFMGGVGLLRRCGVRPSVRHVQTGRHGQDLSCGDAQTP